MPLVQPIPKKDVFQGELHVEFRVMDYLIRHALGISNFFHSIKVALGRVSLIHVRLNFKWVNDLSFDYNDLLIDDAIDDAGRLFMSWVIQLIFCLL
jgi:hypothetical protein